MPSEEKIKPMKTVNKVDLSTVLITQVSIILTSTKSDNLSLIIVAIIGTILSIKISFSLISVPKHSPGRRRPHKLILRIMEHPPD